MPEQPRYALRRLWRKLYVRFSHHGRRVEIPIGTDQTTDEEARALAEKAIADHIRRAQREDRTAQARNPLDRYAKRIAGANPSHVANCARYRARLTKHFPGRDLRTLTQADVERWRDWLLTLPVTHTTAATRETTNIPGRTLSKKSVREHLSWLSSVYRLAGLPNPCANVLRPQKTDRERQDALKHFSRDEMTKLFTAARGEPFENSFIFLAYTGCRSGGLRNLKIDDCEADTRTVWLNEKGAKRRRLILTGACAPAWQAIVDQIRDHPRRDGHVFPHGATWCYKGMARLCAKAEIQFRGPHAVRHTFVSHALFVWRPAWEIAKLSRWIGHADVSTTMRIYAHWIPIEAPSSWLEPPKKTAKAKKTGKVLGRPKKEVDKAKKISA